MMFLFKMVPVDVVVVKESVGREMNGMIKETASPE
jgi:hypothetical protein